MFLMITSKLCLFRAETPPKTMTVKKDSVEVISFGNSAGQNMPNKNPNLKVDFSGNSAGNMKNKPNKNHNMKLRNSAGNVHNKQRGK